MKQPVGLLHHSFGLRPARLPLLLVWAVSLWAGALAAAEIHTWTDENGVVHYSQTPPPQGGDTVVEMKDAYKPGSVPAQPPAADGGAGGTEPAALTPAEARRQQMAQQRQANRERQAQNQQLCGMHRQRLEQLEPARRVFYTDETGESVRMDDDQRLALIEESRAFLDENCSD